MSAARRCVIIVASINCLFACTSAEIYEGARQNRQIECRKLPQQQYDDCMKQYEDDYRAYQKKRESVLK